MKHLRLLIITCLVLVPTLCRAADDGYGYPFPGAYEATILGTPTTLKPQPPEAIPVQQRTIDVLPDLQKPEIFFYDEGVRYSLAAQEKKAPLVFLIAGTGSSNRAPKLVTMMEELYTAGYHVVTLPSPTHPNFIISASSSHVPGELTEDAADLYRLMENIWNRIKGEIEVSDFSLVGYSLGGTQAAFVAKLDEERKRFNFRKVLLINPAVNLYTSMARIEALLDKIPGGPRKIGAFFNSMLAKFTAFYREGDFIGIHNEFFYAAYKSRLLSEDEGGGLIGLSFRINAAGMIFASDLMTNGGYVVPKHKVLVQSDLLEDYFQVCVHLSFLDYFNEYFYPYFLMLRPGIT
ncbi:MAG: alpha/beta fold hydrolase [candidate division NC10 bacterium]|nr:alpha/beta fold hydrolase [candidate division NC10 bacterium]